ncbi:hypothetical protein IPP75_06195 [Candidatus Saccharibacteria bacterium]|nr:MAG: hypothetical protein IPP75_06195 [Candidatus Saccharibacteria bacterium]
MKKTKAYESPAALLAGIIDGLTASQLRHSSAAGRELSILQSTGVNGFGGRLQPLSQESADVLASVIPASELETRRQRRANDDVVAVAVGAGVIRAIHGSSAPEAVDTSFLQHAESALDVENTLLSNRPETHEPFDASDACIVDTGSRSPRVPVDADKVRGGLFLQGLLDQGFRRG